jgi:hypothetical protein
MRTGYRRENFFLANVGQGSPLAQSPPTPAAYRDNSNYYAQWAEVAWFLRPLNDATGKPIMTTGDLTASPPVPPEPRFALFRRQLLAVPDNTTINTTNRQPANQQLTSPGYVEVSCTADPTAANSLYFNNPLDLTAPVRRYGMLQPTGAMTNPNVLASAGVLVDGANQAVLTQGHADPNAFYPTFGDLGLQALTGSDLVMTDVISFDTKVIDTTIATDFFDLFDPRLYQTNSPYWGQNPAFFNPNNTTSPAPAVFDTWSGQVKPNYYDYSTSIVPGQYTSIPLKIKVKAVQISIRVWDQNTQKTRQVTVVQDL